MQVGDLSTLHSLKRLDLSSNLVQSCAFASTCTGLKWLSLAHNPMADLSPLSCLQSLQVSFVSFTGVSLAVTSLAKVKKGIQGPCCPQSQHIVWTLLEQFLRSSMWGTQS